MEAAAAIRRHRPDSESPLEPSELRELAEDVGDEEPVAGAIARWLEVFAERPQEVWQVLEPLVEEPLPPLIETALSGFSQQLDSADRFDLVAPALGRAV